MDGVGVLGFVCSLFSSLFLPPPPTETARSNYTQTTSTNLHQSTWALNGLATYMLLISSSHSERTDATSFPHHLQRSFNSGAEVPQDAIRGGQEPGGEPLYVARAHVEIDGQAVSLTRTFPFPLLLVSDLSDLNSRP